MDDVAEWRVLTEALPDLSLPQKDNLVPGTLGQMLECGRKDSGKILSALDFPLEFDGYWGDERTKALGTEGLAWQATAGQPGWGRGAGLPVGEMRWGQAGLSGALDSLRMVSEGLGTFVNVQCGSQYWMVVKGNEKMVGRIGVFSPLEFKLKSPPGKARFEMEGMVLRPGTMLWVPVLLRW